MKNRLELRGQEVLIHLKSRKGEHISAVIDAADLVLADSYPGTWHASWNRATKSNYVEGNYRWPDGWGKLKLHRLLAAAPDGLDVDHRSHDTLDNRQLNLRRASRTLNNLNRRGARGAIWCGQSGKWIARLQYLKKFVHLGSFDDPDLAAAVSRAARIDLEALLEAGSPINLDAIRKSHYSDKRYKQEGMIS